MSNIVFLKSNKSSKATKLTEEERNLLQTIEALKLELDLVHKSFDHITDPLLIDSCIYEISAIHSKYTYYLKLCKQKGISS